MFYQKMSSEVDNQMENEQVFKMKSKREEQDIDRALSNILDQANLIMNKTKIVIDTVSESSFRIDQDNLVSDLETTMVLQSHLIADVSSLKKSRSLLRSLRDKAKGLLFEKIRFHSNYQAKTKNATDAFIERDDTFITIRTQVEHIESMAEERESYSYLLSEKLRSLRTLLYNRSRNQNYEND